MVSFSWIRGAFALKLVSAVVGAVLVVIALSYFANEFGFLLRVGFPGIPDIVIIVSILGVFLSGIALLAELPNSMRVRFQRIPARRKPTKVYGFGSVVAIGLGATLGSPLFLLIPLNVVQYQIASIGSLVLAAILSILMARIYATNYAITKENNLESVGGPGFLKASTGKRSFRYFFSRVSMAVGNIAIAAYSAIVFVLFDFQVLPTLLSGYGISQTNSQTAVYVLAGLFVGWFLLNSLFETRFIRFIGRIQIVFTVILVALIVYNSAALGSVDSWNFSGLFSLKNLPGGNLLFALVSNTAYLYLLFFGFQEIQAMERETKEESGIPIVSWIKPNFKLRNVKYISLAMTVTVLIAAIVNIFYALAVFTAHPDLSALSSSQIPALFVARQNLGLDAEASLAIAFLIATFTTFVPSFLAASRHISSLAEDGFMPQSLSKVAWVFVLVSIGILSVAGQGFLVSITDFMVLISLGMISLSAIWIVKGRTTRFSSRDFMPLLVGFGCFVAAAAVYSFDPSVAVFGSLAVLVSYLLFDVFELGSVGVELFLGLFNLVVYTFLTIYSHGYVSQNFFLFNMIGIPPLSGNILATIMLVTSPLLLANFAVNTKLRVSKPVVPRTISVA
jgi:amino acid transporter